MTVALQTLLRSLCAVVLLTASAGAAVHPALGGSTRPAEVTDGRDAVVYEGNASREQFQSAAAVRRAVGDGRLREDGPVVVRNLLVVELRNESLANALAARRAENATSATAAFFSLVAADGVTFAVTQTNPPPSFPPKAISLAPNSTTVYADAPNGTTYLLVSLSAVSVGWEDDYDDREAELEPGDEFRVRLEATAASNVTGAPFAESATFRTTERRATAIDLVDGPDDRLRRAPTANQTLRFNTTVFPGQRVTVAVWFAAGTRFDAPNLLRRNVTVTDGDGANRITASFDLSGFADEAFEYAVLLDGERIGHGHGWVRNRTATVRGLDPKPNGVPVEGRLSHGGFLVLHAGGPEGPVVGSSPFLGSGSYTTTVEVRNRSLGRLYAVAHYDANGDREFQPGVDEPYRENGSAVAARTGLVLTPTATPTESPTPTDSPTPTPTDSPTPTPTATPAESETTTTAPGFGALLGALAVALALWRKQ